MNLTWDSGNDIEMFLEIIDERYDGLLSLESITRLSGRDSWLKLNSGGSRMSRPFHDLFLASCSEITCSLQPSTLNIFKLSSTLTA